jgi:hypothetical protein
MRTDIVSFLVLDYRKPDETRSCLQSIRRHAKIPHQIIYLDNGSRESYPWYFYQEGLCDIFLSKKRGYGGGVGQTDLFRFCNTQYAYFVQSDQLLIHDITLDIQDRFITALTTGARVIDLNGDQSQVGRWTDRAHFIDVGWFNSLAPFPDGGPGEWHHLRWNENYLQEIFDKLDNPIVHVKPTMFADRGVYTVRELPCGGIVRMRTDTKAVEWLIPPKEPYIFPEHTEAEWATVIRGEWIAGTIPDIYLKRGDSFNHWTKL